MVPRIPCLHPKTYKRLICLRKQAEPDGAQGIASSGAEIGGTLTASSWLDTTIAI
jgi:hypothetical protein